MRSVMIRCPATGNAVSTAIETEPSAFRKLPKVAAPHALPGMRAGSCVDRTHGSQASRGRWTMKLWLSKIAAASQLARLAEPHRGFQIDRNKL